MILNSRACPTELKLANGIKETVVYHFFRLKAKIELT
jgi:hypothetical protein